MLQLGHKRGACLETIMGKTMSQANVVEPTPTDWLEYQQWLDAQPPCEVLNEDEFVEFVNRQFQMATSAGS